MAKKLSRAKPRAEDLDVLHPERTLTLAGRQLTLREYGFVEGLRLRPLMQPLLDDLHRAVAAGKLPELESVLVILANHYEASLDLVAVAADVERAWIDTLSQDDGYLLLTVWWSVNGPFFLRSVVQRIAAAAVMEAVRAQAKAPVGPISTPPLSPLATAALNESAP